MFRNFFETNKNVEHVLKSLRFLSLRYSADLRRSRLVIFQFRQVLQTEKGGKILDVGCGFGISSIVMARGFPNATVDAVEPDTKSMSLAGEKLSNEEPEVQERLKFHCSFLEDAGLAG